MERQERQVQMTSNMHFTLLWAAFELVHESMSIDDILSKQLPRPSTTLFGVTNSQLLMTERSVREKRVGGDEKGVGSWRST